MSTDDTAAHPTDEVLIRYVRCQLRANDEIEPNHVVGCQRCNDRIAELDIAPPWQPQVAATVPTATLGDDELLAIANEACAYVDDPASVAGLSVDSRAARGIGYIAGVQAERLRSRARVAELERRLAAIGDTVCPSCGYQYNEVWCGKTHERVGKLVQVEAGLLDGEP